MFNKKSKNPLHDEHAHTLIHRCCALRQAPLLHMDDVTGNLRIADGSIMPRIATGKTIAPCVAIGGSAAEILRQIPKCRPVFTNLSISLGRITPDALLCRDLDNGQSRRLEMRRQQKRKPPQKGGQDQTRFFQIWMKANRRSWTASFTQVEARIRHAIEEFTK